MSSDLLQEDVDLYVRISEQWLREDKGVRAAYSLNDLLCKASNLFDVLISAEERWRVELCRGQAEYSAEQEALYTRLIQVWLTACEPFVGVLQAFESAGLFVKHARRFRRCVREAQGIMTPDAEFFSHDRLVEQRDRAFDEACR